MPIQFQLKILLNRPIQCRLTFHFAFQIYLLINWLNTQFCVSIIQAFHFKWIGWCLFLSIVHHIYDLCSLKQHCIMVIQQQMEMWLRMKSKHVSQPHRISSAWILLLMFSLQSIIWSKWLWLLCQKMHVYLLPGGFYVMNPIKSQTISQIRGLILIIFEHKNEKNKRIQWAQIKMNDICGLRSYRWQL